MIIHFHSRIALIRRFSILNDSASPSSSLSPSIQTLLKACRTLRNLEQVHTHVIYRGYEQYHFLMNQFISLSYSFSSSTAYATSVFERVEQPNIYLWNNLINGCCQYSSLAESFSLLNRMKQCMNVVPDTYTFPSLVKACSSVLALREGQAIHGLVVRYGTEGDLYVGSSLIDLYGKCGEIDYARKVFDGMFVRNEVSWTAMIVGYVTVGKCLEAKKLFDEMPKRNLASQNAMIKGFVGINDLNNARKLFDEMSERDVVTFTTMIDGYAKAGDMASARFLFDQSPDRDIVSWSALISGYAQNGQPNNAVKLFLEMLERNVKPDEFIMVSLMSASSQIGIPELAKWVDSYISQSSMDIRRVHVATALIDMNAKCGNMDRASMLFENLPKRDLVSYCSMMQGLSIHGYGAQAVDLFERMLKEGLTPDHVAYTVILTACSRAELVEEGCRYFDSMINDFCLVPSPDQYACMVDLLGRSGKLEAAYELIKSMPVEPHACAWGALLGACKMHHNIELGEEVARRLFEIEPQNAGNYVVLSDIYAASDRWCDVSLVRMKMDEKGAKKITGRSWI